MMVESTKQTRNYLKGIIKKKWYSYVFLVALFMFFCSITSLFVNNLFLMDIIDVSDWTSVLLEKLSKWIGSYGNQGLLIMFYTYGNRLGLILLGISFFFGGLTDYTLPNKVRKSLIIAVGVALGGYFIAYLLYIIIW